MVIRMRPRQAQQAAPRFSIRRRQASAAMKDARLPTTTHLFWEALQPASPILAIRRAWMPGMMPSKN
jgi:hypothetical protein